MYAITPDQIVQLYNDDKDHFLHILDNLFVPILEELEYEVIKPIAEGSEIIHTRIINNLIESDLVFCDMSILNPNVFYELGIRTAINKKVCIVKDDKTIKIPFDTSLINIFTYDSMLSHWKMDEIKKTLKDHIIATEKHTSNALWDIFGSKTQKLLNSAVDNIKNKNETDPNDQIDQVRDGKENIEVEIKKEKTEKRATVFRAKAHKCTSCGYSFLLDDNDFIMASALRVSISGLYSPMTDIPESNVVRCPKCDNIDVL